MKLGEFQVCYSTRSYIFLNVYLSCMHDASLFFFQQCSLLWIRLHGWRLTSRKTVVWRIKQSILVWDKILIISLFVYCFYRNRNLPYLERTEISQLLSELLLLCKRLALDPIPCLSYRVDINKTLEVDGPFVYNRHLGNNCRSPRSMQRSQFPSMKTRY